MKKLKILEATYTTSVAPIFIGSLAFPRNGGRCFRVRTDNPEVNKKGLLAGVPVANCKYENFKELLRRKVVDFPIEAVLYRTARGASAVKIIDSRIPPEWLLSNHCRVCCGDKIFPCENVNELETA